VISNSRRSIDELATDVMRLSQDDKNWSKSSGALEFMVEFERHSDNPKAFEELLDALDARGGGAVDLIILPLAELAFIPLVVMHQHAVGHGGFHTGAMGRGSARLRWVYDCGSLRSAGQERLTTEIGRLAAGSGGEKRHIDLLFISHFDRDHVSGIVELMSKIEVGTVIIPYLDDLERTIALLDDVVKNEGSDADITDEGTLRQALFDPAGWLTDLGAARVVQIRPGGPDTPMSRIFDFGPGSGPEIALGTRGAQAVLVPQIEGSATESDEQPIVDAGSAWMVTHFGRRFGDWCFLPYVTAAADSVRRTFAIEMRKLLEQADDEGMVAAFQRQVDTDGFAAKVKTAYHACELGDANAVSMSLYVGPFREGVWRSRQPLRAGQKWSDAGPGWLLTGDAKLEQVGRRKQWVKFYEKLRQRIGALMLPHHGSHRNFHEGILDVMRKDGLVFACRREKATGDPLHENVWPHVEDMNNAIVSDDERSSLMQVSGSPTLESAERVLSNVAEEWR